jgi:MoxR-like ATPase
VLGDVLVDPLREEPVARKAALGAATFEEQFDALVSNVERVIQGKRDVIRMALACLVADGHLLIEDVPGVGKTMLAKAIARSIDGSWHRIQFTPDLLPSDVTGVSVWNRADNEFEFRSGGIFANIVLADEVNRASPKTQSALLEAMEERQVTVDAVTHDLQRPFMVMATQNPIEYEGTYPLPEAQLDRFMFMIQLDYPSYAEEVNIVKNTTNDLRYEVKKVVTAEEIMDFQHLVRRVPVTDHVIEYAVKLVHKTRPSAGLAVKDTNDYLEWGAGPRASQALILAAKCNALLSGKYSPDIEDVKAVALPVLRHRIIRNFKAEAEGISVDDIIARLV